jgi:LysM repeat protein
MPEAAMSRSLAFASLAAVSASLAAGPPAPAPGGCGAVHIVARGDTLYSIARRCGSTVVGIAQASGLADPRRIEVGQRLMIPGQGPPAAAEPGKEEPAAESPLLYRFAPGDTLYSLARWARVGVGPLIAANPGIDPHKIEIGDAVRLPTGAVDPDAARRRERGDGALATPRIQPEQPRPAPPVPRHREKPDEDDERAPEGM